MQISTAVLLDSEDTEWVRKIIFNLNGKDYKVSLVWSQWNGYEIHSLDENDLYGDLEELGLEWSDIARELDDLTEAEA
jgi:hypothetical protein